MLAKIQSFVLQGIEALPCEVEVDVGDGEGEYDKPQIVGLADMGVRESLERIRTGLHNSGYHFPYHQVLVNLAPGDIRKEGCALELPIVLGLLRADGIIEGDRHREFLVAGEIGLDGSVRPIRGALSMAMLAAEQGRTGVLVPPDNAAEASVVPGLKVYPIDSITTLVGFLNDMLELQPIEMPENPEPVLEIDYPVDFAEVRGQELAKRALTIAAAGRHNILMLGPPGSGKTMLCARLPTILPPLTRQEALETSRVYSACGLMPRGISLLQRRPVRMPHHNASGAAIVGGGTIPRPGEVSLAHHGVLFLDELPEFPRAVLELLRQPIESGEVTIARAHSSVRFPARFMLVAAMNPSAGGSGQIAGGDQEVDRYLGRLSGPLLDRIDIHLEVPAVTYQDLVSRVRTTSSQQMRRQVMEARKCQIQRFGPSSTMTNATMGPRELDQYAQLDAPSLELMRQAMEQMGLSARAFDKVRRVARTLADLEGVEHPGSEHINEAIGYRLLDRRY